VVQQLDTLIGPAQIGVLLAAAATVGNAEAINHYLARGGEAIGRRPNTRNDDYDRPIEAATSTGKTWVVQRLLDIVQPRVSTMTAMEKHDNFANLATAARFATKAGHTDTAYLLLKFI
jgi:hypothetical protein